MPQMPQIKKLVEEIKRLIQRKKRTANKQELNKIEKRIDRVRATVYRESMKSPQGSRVQKILVKKEALEDKLESLEKETGQARKQYSRTVAEAGKTDLEKRKEKEKKKFSLFDLLIRLLILIICLILLFLIYCVIVFFLSYLKEKNKFKRASRESKYNLAIVLLYNFLCRILNIFGYRYPVVIDPEEYSIKVSRRFRNLQSDINLLTTVFLEARYSTHEIIKQQVEKALACYKNILIELKSTGTFWQKIILKLDFVFKLQTQK